MGLEISGDKEAALRRSSLLQLFFGLHSDLSDVPSSSCFA